MVSNHSAGWGWGWGWIPEGSGDHLWEDKKEVGSCFAEHMTSVRTGLQIGYQFK